MVDVPTPEGFLAFIRDSMKITASDLPDNSPSIDMAYRVAIEIVSLTLECVSPLIYTLAVYNLGGDNLINYAQDQDGRETFTKLRTQFNILGFVSGVIQSSSDNGTGEAMVVQEAAKNFTLSDLQNLKTPWGRRYLEFAQMYGPNLWGLT